MTHTPLLDAAVRGSYKKESKQGLAANSLYEPHKIQYEYPILVESFTQAVAIDAFVTPAHGPRATRFLNAIDKYEQFLERHPNWVMFAGACLLLFVPFYVVGCGQ